QRHRVPLWLNRQRSKRLLDAVRGFPDFPLLLETWRTCLQDEMDLGTLRDLLGEVERGEIEVVEVTTSKPSPFAANLGWKQTNKLMYEDDTPEGGPSRLGDDLLAEVTLSAALRPRVPPAAAEELRRKLQRTWPGYAPAPDEVADWVRERLALPLGEWRELLDAVARDAGVAEAELLAVLEPSQARLAAIAWPAAAGDVAGEAWLVTSVELLPRLLTVLGLSEVEITLGRPFALHAPLGDDETRELLAL